jgi:hypothetical protein
MPKKKKPIGMYCTSTIIKDGKKTEIREFISFEHGIEEVHRQADGLALKVQEKAKKDVA